MLSILTTTGAKIQGKTDELCLVKCNAEYPDYIHTQVWYNPRSVVFLGLDLAPVLLYLVQGVCFWKEAVANETSMLLYFAITAAICLQLVNELGCCALLINRVNSHPP